MITPCELTQDQKDSWDAVMSLFSWQAPGFQHLWYKLLTHNDGGYYAVPTKAVPIAGTDARNVLINPDRFFNYSLKEQVFIAAHEVVHNVYGDVELLHSLKNAANITCSDGRVFPYKPDVAQKAMDYRINALLVESRIGTLPADGLYDPKIAEGKDGFFDIYGKVYAHDQGDNSQGSGGNGFDPDGILDPGASTGTPTHAGNTASRNPQQWALELAHARSLEDKRHQGRMPGGMQHMFGAILEPEIHWTKYIETIINRRCGSDGYNWRKPDRRYIVRDCYMPSRSGYGAGWVVIWGDTSGSRTDSEIDKSLSEIAGIIKQTNPRRLSVVWGDSKIHDVDEIYDEADVARIIARGVVGRGGTDVGPVYTWIADQREVPDIFIGFTDGELAFPDDPGFPVVWASSTDAKYPYGEVVGVK